MEEFIKMMNDLKISQNSIEWLENIPNEIYKKYFYTDKGEKLYYILDEGLNIEKHRWYELSTTVVSFPLGIFGIRHINNLYSENSDCGDIGHILKFFEVEEVNITTYIRKK